MSKKTKDYIKLTIYVVCMTGVFVWSCRVLNAMHEGFDVIYGLVVWGCYGSGCLLYICSDLGKSGISKGKHGDWVIKILTVQAAILCFWYICCKFHAWFLHVSDRSKYSSRIILSP